MPPATSRKKLIEVALPLDAINKAAAREKSIRHGHPSTLHLWWARRPLAAARAVIFAQMVDDPAEYVDELLADPAKKQAAERACNERRAEQAAQRDSPPAPAISPPTLEAVIAEIERERLFGILEDLVRWENTTNEAVLAPARAEIRQSWRRACADNAGHPRAKALFNPDRLPAFHDPFAGGGALPLEAQRLGLEAHASDLNPVAGRGRALLWSLDARPGRKAYWSSFTPESGSPQKCLPSGPTCTGRIATHSRWPRFTHTMKTPRVSGRRAAQAAGGGAARRARTPDNSATNFSCLAEKKRYAANV